MQRKTMLVCILGGLFAFVVSAPSQTSDAKSPTLVGSWQLTLTPTSPAGNAAIPGLATFTSDGSVIETDGAELVGTPPSSGSTPAPTSPGHGIWQPAPAVGHFYVEYISVVVNSDGSLVGKNVTTYTGVAIDGTTKPETFTGSYTTDFVSTSGTTRVTSGKVEGMLIPHPALP
jgi:hypothetical protein